MATLNIFRAFWVNEIKVLFELSRELNEFLQIKLWKREINDLSFGVGNEKVTKEWLTKDFVNVKRLIN